jgi:hypothetical protein
VGPVTSADQLYQVILFFIVGLKDINVSYENLHVQTANLFPHYLEGWTSSKVQCTSHVSAAGGPALTASLSGYTKASANGNLQIISITPLFTLAFQNPPDLGKNLSFAIQLVTQYKSRKQHLQQIL